jgi:hypothetical protein
MTAAGDPAVQRDKMPEIETGTGSPPCFHFSPGLTWQEFQSLLPSLASVEFRVSDFSFLRWFDCLSLVCFVVLRALRG